MSRATIRGAELAYDVAGSGPGPDVVLIHSALADRRMWAGQLAVLTPRHRVLSLDLRGFGESTLPAGEFSMNADVAELMAAVGMTRAVVIGSSMGGGVAIDFALDHPDLLAGLVLVGAGLRGTKPSDLLQRVDAEVDALVERGAIDEAVERELQLWLDGPGRPAGTVAGAIREYVRETDLAVTRRAAAWSQAKGIRPTPPVNERLEQIVAPTLVVVGEHDVPDMVTQAVELARRIPNAERIVIPGAAHLPSLERPDEFNAHLIRFLGRLAGSAG